MNSPQVNFIAFEGADGVGKSSLVTRVMDLLLNDGATVLRTGRNNPLGPKELGELVTAASALFRVSEALDLPIPFLALVAAAQHQSMIHGLTTMTLPACSSSAQTVVLADSWWGKTLARFTVDMELRNDPAYDVHLDKWLSQLMDFPPTDFRQLTVLVTATDASRRDWYQSAPTRQRVFDDEGLPTTDLDDFVAYSGRVQRRLEAKARERGWPSFNNKPGQLDEVASEINAWILDQGIL